MLYIAYWTVQATVFQQLIILTIRFYQIIIRGGSRAAATSKMERFVIIVNCWKQLDVARANNALYCRSAFKVAALPRCSYRKVF